MDEPIISDMLDALPDIDLDLDFGIDGGGRANQRVVVAMSAGGQFGCRRSGQACGL